MRLRKMTLLILAALLLVSFTACDSKEKKGVDNKKSTSNLKIYYMDYDMKIQNALSKFSEKYKDVNVDGNIFHNNDDYKTKVTMDILSGEGPDVIFLRPGWFESVNKFSSSGALCDLNEFIKKDEDFKMSDYNENILNSFEKDGKRLIIPLNYTANMLITSKEALQRNNIKIDLSNWSYNGLLQVARKFQEENRDKNKYLFDDGFSISRLIKGSGILFVDFKNKKSMFNSKDFIEILETYKGIYPAICTDEAVKGVSIDNCLKNDAYIMTVDSKTSLYSISSNYSLYKSIGEEMELYPFPALKEGNSSPVFYSDYAVGINSQSKNKEAAYDFIKILMSKDLQKMSGGENIIMETPVNKAAYEEDSGYYMGKESEGISWTTSNDGSSSYSYLSISLPKNIKVQLDSMISKTGKCEIEDTGILNIVKEALPDFLSSKKTAAQTAKEIDGKVSLYLNE